jgi:hypothetical protein
MLWVLVGIVLGLLRLRYDGSFLFGGLFMLCIVAGIITILLAPKLRCPTCGADAGGDPEVYCPECGNSPLSEKWFLARSCNSCGRSLVRGKNRQYRVRFCTSCGAYLDENGV